MAVSMMSELIKETKWDRRSIPTGNREIEENEEKIKLTLWENEIDYEGKKINVIRLISKDKKTGKYSKWMWITNRKQQEKMCEKYTKNIFQNP